MSKSIIKPWDRQKGESALRFRYFTEYLNAGVVRKIVDVAKKYNKSEGYIYNISRDYKWMDRADKYDAYLQEEKKKADLKAVMDMNNDVIEKSHAVRFIVGKKIKSVLTAIQEAGDNQKQIDEILKTVPITALSDMLERSFELERKALGISDDSTKININNMTKVNVDTSPKPELKNLSLEQLQQLKAIKEAAEKKGN
jgi:hypothetical protein